MKYETIKSIVLTILVCTSVFFTWSLWTYQPKYDFIENAKYIQNVPVSNVAVDYGTVIQPRYIFIHKNGNHYGITHHPDIYKFMKELKTWTFDHFEDISGTIKKEKFLSFVHGKGQIEIIYPDDIPIEMYRTIFQIEDRDIEKVRFDRIIIPIDESKQEINVYFICANERRVYKAVAQSASIEHIKQTYYTQAERYTSFLSYDINETKFLFLPARPLVLNRLQYYMDELSTERFKDALFTDPSFVKKDVLAFGEEYTDGSRLMDVDLSKKLLLYVNPAARGEIKTSDPNVLQKSIDFVNDHGGWTDTYYFDRLDENDRKVTFRLFANGYPVFNRYGMAEIIQIWGENEIISYQRPLFTLAIPDRVSLPITLPSGYEVIDQLKKQKNIQHELIDDIVIGYELIRDTERENIVMLEPAWYCLYNGTWRKVVMTTDERRGDIIGLE
ncbi:Two-component signal transduction system YycFG, regulatory protein YycH [Anoxybacillus pushchinoensis]|uniref:Two-component signal transduction system YycFG, regulatory protein YycH n=1 Tax=Anoxybacillus pushchinoensis TaxID=150248 RepID=A0A1I0TDM4_9BACL|nr:two-component system activity regulator YycH [Anoxybacillus pushchinoensis]SFA49885.1 Two-component signal transduction system YycFG, regulatory protein YycH [Anoxybacillus pushchinoensis]